MAEVVEMKERGLSLDTLLSSTNLANELTDERLEEIGAEVCANFKLDDESRKEWKKRNEEANKLAMQVAEDKSYPWENASNVKFPLLTIAAIQFASRAYPALVKAPDLVKYRVQGADPGGQKAARAQRVSAHMSYQMLEEDESWEEEQDKAFLVLPIAGSVFKKTYYDPTKEHNCSEMVLPKDLCIHYYAKSVEEADRKTHEFDLSPRLVKERQLRKIYKNYDLPVAQQQEAPDTDNRQGVTAPIGDSDRPRRIYEQHTYMDLDNDGYKEPYVITVDKDTQKVFRIVQRFKKVTSEQSIKIEENNKRIREIAESLQGIEQTEQNLEVAKAAEQTIKQLTTTNEMLKGQKQKILRIEPVEFFTKYPFIPAPDGGIYDLGFGSLLSPLNDSVNTLINQLIDAGTLQNSNSGFMGRGARIKGGRVRFQPNEWKRVDVPGATLRDAIVPLPVNQPSAVLFQLLGLLISYTERVSSVTEAMSGENPGQNTPAYNMSAMLEQGLQVFNGIFKRTYRAFRSELRKSYALNSMYMDVQTYFDYQDAATPIAREDYQGDAKDLIPAADPNAFSNKEKQMKAMMVSERAQMVGGYDPIKVEQLFLESIDIPDAAELFPVVPNEEGVLTLAMPPPPNPEINLKIAEEERRTQESKDRYELGLMKAMDNSALVEAQILEIEARAEVAADAPELERLKLLQKETAERRKVLLEMVKEENGREKDRGLDGKSGND